MYFSVYGPAIGALSSEASEAIIHGVTSDSSSWRSQEVAGGVAIVILYTLTVATIVTLIRIDRRITRRWKNFRPEPALFNNKLLHTIKTL